MSDAAIALLAGLVIFVVPAGAFAWSVLTKKGRATYERGVRQWEGLLKWGGVIPLKPPTGRFSRWGTEHPNAGALTFAFAAGVVWFLFDLVVLDRTVEKAVGRALFGIIEYGIFARFFFGAMHKHYALRSASGTERPPKETEAR